MLAQLTLGFSIGCIDKSSSAELQEAINSMYRWYANAQICFAYITDVLASCPILLDADIKHTQHAGPLFSELWRLYESRTGVRTDSEDGLFWSEAFRNSVWFSRGWTLQELIAPREIYFFASSWTFFAAKSRTYELISDITKIDRSILEDRENIRNVCVGRKMSWAANRRTSRPEDRAYSLLGVFDVSMPMLYGEGGPKAFLRLQEALLRGSTDLSIFAWGCDGRQANGMLFAESPDDFAGGNDLVQFGRPRAFQLTNRGLQVSIPIVDLKRGDGMLKCLAVIYCRNSGGGSQLLALNLYTDEQNGIDQPILHMSLASNSPRIHSVKLSQLVDARWSDVEISRHDETFGHSVDFYVEGLGGLHVVDLYVAPSERGQWYRNPYSISVSDGASPVALGMRLRSEDDNKYFVVFGYHVAQGNAAPSPTSQGRFMPVIRCKEIYSTLGGYSTDRLLRALRCPHTGIPCERAECWRKGLPSEERAVSHATMTTDGSSETLDCWISHREVLGGNVFVVKIRLTKLKRGGLASGLSADLPALDLGGLQDISDRQETPETDSGISTRQSIGNEGPKDSRPSALARLLRGKSGHQHSHSY